MISYYIAGALLLVGAILVIQKKNLWFRPVGALFTTVAFWWGIGFVMYQSMFLVVICLILGIISFIAFFVYGDTAMKKEKKN